MSPAVLELRIHGVFNTPPGAMLALPDYAVEQSRGDRFSSFWRGRPRYLAEQAEDHPAHVGEGVHREAYSWGGLARSSPGAPGTGVASVVLNAIGRVGWALLLPFGLTNVAYWSRRLPVKAAKGASFDRGAGAASTRLFGLGLTVLLVLAVCEVAVDVVAVQCASSTACTTGSGVLTWLGGRDPAIRVLLSSLVPVVLLLLFLLLTTLSRIKYEKHTSDQVRAVRKNDVMLSDPDLWTGDQGLRTLIRLHLAAGFGTVALVSSVDLWRHTAFLTTSVLGAAVVLAACWMTCWSASDCPDVPSGHRAPGWSRLVVICSTGVLVAQGVALAVVRPDIPASLWSTTWLPPFVVAGLLGVVLSALAWRSNSTLLPLACGVVVALGLAGSRWVDLAWVGSLLAAAGLVWLARPRERGRWEAWSGTAPSVLLGLALTASLTLSAMLVLTTSGWIGDDVVVPAVYRWFSGSFAAALGLLVVLVVVLGLMLVQRLIEPVVLAAASTSDPSTQRLTRWRHIAALTHRSEKLIGVLALLGVAASSLTAYGSLVAPAWATTAIPVWLLDRGAWITGAAGVSVVGAFVGGGLLGNKRPLGLVWDLICFLPRAAHPFAPPCYAERAIPELVDRTEEWLDQDQENRVVLSAHSLGAVLAVATLYALPDRYLPRMALLTYGSQLRPYFARIFPELLGDTVLGTLRCRAGSLFGCDPWSRRKRDQDEPKPTGGLYGSVPWINLWRRTDFLGFPVHGYGPDGNQDDWAAPEINRTAPDRIQRHSDYHLCDVYRTAVTDLLSRPSPRQPT
ncbi:energy-coupling factor transporter transmembrane protein EcfT [Umezawaea endophytica]|uniref:Energy-coupling factor transporter transmembrane protein EcfT n=1 Tax=Umezawaea endophytica TaxID=1654476 RepID=A0A9X3AG45_9PSEU|nr:energy-coupling factor transporter transmembrane protein EcfT [Umezawaea endophytica]MCS7477990.1 energy-coupling factor transporter transmembrane protein EcfT [Umezawaea endophytica]